MLSSSQESHSFFYSTPRATSFASACFVIYLLEGSYNSTSWYSPHLYAVLFSDISKLAGATEERKHQRLFRLGEDDQQSFPQPIFYVKRFPEDPYCEETATNARAWRMYVEEAASFDGTMIGQYRDGLDVTLVFVGVISSRDLRNN